MIGRICCVAGLFVLAFISGGCSSSDVYNSRTGPLPSGGQDTGASEALAMGLSRQGTTIFGSYLQADPGNGSGVLIGFGKYTALTNRKVSKETLRGMICFMGSLGFNYFRTFTALGVGDQREDFVSPWKNTAEWQDRRNALLQAGVDCHVYIQLSLFDEPDRNDESKRGEGYSREDNSWKGRDPGLVAAKELTSQFYLAGLDPNSPMSKALIVEHANEPDDDWWSNDWDSPFDAWLESQGWKFTGSGLGGDYDRSKADKIEIHIRESELPDAIGAAKKVREDNQRASAVSTDGAGFIAPDKVASLMRGGLQNGISIEYLMSGLDPYNMDTPVSDGEWKGKTTRSYLEQVAASSGIKPLGGPAPAPTASPIPPSPRNPKPTTGWTQCALPESTTVFSWAQAYTEELFRAFGSEANPSGVGYGNTGYSLTCFLYRNMIAFGFRGYINNVHDHILKNQLSGNVIPGGFSSKSGEEILDLFYRNLLRRGSFWSPVAGEDATGWIQGWNHYYDPSGANSYLSAIGQGEFGAVAEWIIQSFEFRQAHPELN